MTNIARNFTKMPNRKERMDWEEEMEHDSKKRKGENRKAQRKAKRIDWVTEQDA